MTVNVVAALNNGLSNHVKTWWKHAVVYQIYPASFCDSNGDGIGDLPGITSKLDYIASLGVNVIWVCPMYDSPQVDMGYDISNYEDVYRPYGTVADMEELIKQTHARGMKIMLDLVVNHTSDQHDWFKESRSSKDNDKADWYIWRPARYNEKGERCPPNNWRSNFGGIPTWTWDETRQEYYLHLFCPEQPDLNWENEETRKAIYNSAMEFWLQRGVDGFRVDTVNMYSKPVGLPDAPITDPKAIYQPAGLVYCNGPRMGEFLGEMNAILSKYGAITVGECPNTPEMSRVLEYVSASSKQLDMVFQFEVLDIGFGTTHKFETKPRNYELPQIKAAYAMTQGLIKGTDGWTTVFMENHDQARSVSRFTDDSPRHRVQGAKLLALMQSCLSGTQYVYQGQEIGCVNGPKDSYPFEYYQDVDSNLFMKYVKEQHGEDNEVEIAKAFDSVSHLARDHARIPMAWNGTGKYGGFSDVAEKEGKPISEPWMKPHPLAGEINVASQVDDANSPLAFWRRALAFRREHADLMVYGDYATVRHDDKDMWMYSKQASNGDKALVVLNFKAGERKWEVPTAEELGLSGGEVELVRVMGTHEGKDGGDVLEAFEGRVYLVKA